MAEIESLKMLKSYSVKSYNLNDNVIKLGVIPKKIKKANGIAIAHTERQAIAMVMGQYGHMNSIDPD